MTMAFFLVSSFLCLLVYNPPPLPTQKGLTSAEKLAKLDWIGFFLLASGIVLFSVGLSYSKNPYEWTDPRVSATFAIGITLALGLVIFETYFKSDGMFHHGLFTSNRNFAVATICIFAEGLAFFAANVTHRALLVAAQYHPVTHAERAATIIIILYLAPTRRASGSKRTLTSKAK